MGLMRFLLLNLLALSCQTQNQSALKHDLGRPTWFGQFDYIELTYEEYTKATRGPFDAPDSQRHLYLQGWVDHIDREVRRRFPAQLAGVPRPKSSVRRTNEVGAFTMGPKSVCYEVPVRINANLAVTESNTLKAVAPRRGHISPDGAFQCQRVVVPKTKFAEFARWYSARFAPCQLTYKPDLKEQDQLQMTGPCAKEDFFPEKSATNLLAVKLAPNRVLLFSGTIDLVESEEELVAIMAHELTHYYRAHVIHEDLYNYCYELKTTNPSSRPVPDPKLDDLCSKLRPRVNFSPEEAAARKMGYYTIEQEADEMALELLAYIGIDPQVAIGAWYKLGMAIAGKSSQHDYDLEHCKRLEDKEWKDANGKDIIVPIGDYRSAHHSWCFRIYNTYKELEAHKYSVTRYIRPKLADWQAVRNGTTNK